MDNLHNEINSWLYSLENVIDHVADNDRIETRIMEGMRTELGLAGMSKTYRDQFIAASDIKIGIDMDPEQEKRLIAFSKKLARVFYEKYSSLGYNDSAIALMGKQLEIRFE